MYSHTGTTSMIRLSNSWGNWKQLEFFWPLYSSYEILVSKLLITQADLNKTITTLQKCGEQESVFNNFSRIPFKLCLKTQLWPHKILKSKMYWSYELHFHYTCCLSSVTLSICFGPLFHICWLDARPPHTMMNPQLSILVSWH